TIPWTEWAHEKGVLTLNQAPHGSPAHPLDNWGASDQPENTGANYLRFGGPARPDAFWMMASSAAHVTGNKIISQETATFMHGHFHNSLGEAKNKEIDKIFLNGSNRIYYHSTTYSPEEATWPGWLYYAPVHFVPANTIWKDFWKLNSYVSRVSSFLQSGDPDNDVLLYFPIYDIWHHQERWVRFPIPTKNLETTATAFLEDGITFDYISDQQILKTVYEDGKLITGGGNDYMTVVIPQVEFMPVQTLDYLTDLAEKGATIVFSGGLPRDVPGFGNLRERQQQFQEQVERIHDFRMRKRTQGKILITAPEGEPILPEEANIPRETMVKEGLRFVRRSYEGGFHYFIKNVSDHRISKFVTLARDAGSAAIFDPLREIAGMATVRKDAEGRTEVFLQLEPEETCILRTFQGNMKGPEWKYEEELHGAHVITGWNVSFLEGGPVIPSGFSSAKPVAWTEKGSEEAKWFAGTAEYSAVFQRPSGIQGNDWILDLGDVFHSAQVEVNGQQVATLITAPFKVNITEALRPGNNDLKVRVTNLAANRIRYMEQNGIERPHFYTVDISFGAYGRLGDPAKWSVMESGLAGPVRLIPATAFDPLQE
ncbi:MAG: hypothetical protein JRE23_13850, partial [Deltaproteobacteria bacterium]|nr:hypothetical protein [Deltaproteobacteria bacterium]